MLTNKKADVNWMMVMMIIAILFLVIWLVIIPRLGKSVGNSIICTDKQCKATCGDDEIPWNFDANRTCEASGRKCCILKTEVPQGTTASSECTGLKAGAKCSTVSGEYYLCNDNSQCITKCEYCGTHPSDTVNCKVTVNKFVFDSNYVCGCTQSECDNLKKLTPPKCITVSSSTSSPGYCYPGAYCCEK